MRLGIDLDGVVANFNKGWMTRYNRDFGANLTQDLVDHWDAAGDLTHFESMRDFWQWAGAAGDGPSIFRDLTAYTGAIETLRQLAHDHDIVILTMKPDWAAADTFGWISDQRLPTREVHLLRDKWRVDCDIYLDDSPYVLPSLIKHRPDKVVCRFVRPWNTSLDGTEDVHDWDSFAALVAREVSRRDHPV